MSGIHARPVSPVLHVVTDSNRRGAQVFAVDLCSTLTELGRPGEVVALAAGGAGAQLDIAVVGRGARSLRTLIGLRARMRQRSVVVAHGSSTLLACTVAGVGLDAPVIYRNISDPAYWLASGSRRARVRLMLSRMSRVVALWPGGAEYLTEVLRISRGRVSVIPNSVRAEAFRPPTDRERRDARARFGIPEDCSVLLYVAALQSEKHPATAVEAMRYLPPDTRLLMLGDGTQRQAVVSLAQRVAPGRVVVAGQVADPLSGYWAADVIVLPSEGEGLPAVLIEAGLCGVPAVASTSGGNADIVLDGRTGAVVEPAQAGQLAAGVRRVLLGRDFMGEAARDHCRERYDMPAVAAQWEAVIADVVDMHVGARR